jgi:predicted transcriptional regulator
VHLCKYLTGMTELPTPAEIENRAKQADLSLSDVCRKAGVAVSTFYRWKAGKTQPTLGVCRKLLEATTDKSAACPPPREGDAA